MLASIAARNATLIPSGVRTQAASHPSGCKDSANRTKNQIYLDFSEMQPLQRHTLREFFLGKKIVNILHKMKKYTKNFGNLRKSSYLCSQEQWTCSIYWDWGVPDRKSCQVRGDSFFYACWDG